MGFWHTGYAEFHEPTGLDGYVYTPPPPVRYVCEHCAATFNALEALRLHRFEDHPLRQPALWIRGQVVGSLPLIVRSSLRPDDVVVEDAKRCKLNGRIVPLAALGSKLAGLTCEFVELELTKDGVVTCCTLDFRIAQEGHLAKVEEAFLRMARDRELSIEAISRFIRDCHPYDDAKPYYNGVCDYLYGVMAKERSADSGLRQDQYVERFVRASEELSGFDRPLARSIRALVAFHFNQFDDAVLLAPQLGSLHQAAATFARLLQAQPWHNPAAAPAPLPASAVEDLLTDQDTLQVLADISHALANLEACAEELLAHQRRPLTSGFDQLKRTLLASETLAARADAASHAQARKLARGLASEPAASVWAEAMLKRLSTP